MLEQYLASIKNYFYKKNRVQMFSDKVPSRIVRPSMYFSLPDVSDALFSKQSFEQTLIIRVKLFEDTSEQALFKAEEIAQSIRVNRFSIPVINEDGSESAERLTFERIDTSLVDDEVSQVTLTFEIQHYFE
jgi:hypothetical protein